MKVSQAIRMLNDNYQPDDEIYIEWWGKDVFDYSEDNPVTDEEWSIAVESAENKPDEMAMSIIYEQLENAIMRASKVSS